MKQFNKIDFIKYRDLINFDEEYVKYQHELLKRLSKYKVKYRNQKLELDYTKRNIISRQRVRKGKRHKKKQKRKKNIK